jgi:hypothetical protein
MRTYGFIGGIVSFDLAIFHLFVCAICENTDTPSVIGSAEISLSRSTAFLPVGPSSCPTALRFPLGQGGGDIDPDLCGTLCSMDTITCGWWSVRVCPPCLPISLLGQRWTFDHMDGSDGLCGSHYVLTGHGNGKRKNFLHPQAYNLSLHDLVTARVRTRCRDKLEQPCNCG